MWECIMDKQVMCLAQIILNVPEPYCNVCAKSHRTDQQPTRITISQIINSTKTILGHKMVQLKSLKIYLLICIKVIWNNH